MVDSIETVVRRASLDADVAKQSAEVERLKAAVTVRAREVDAAESRWSALWCDLGRTPGRADAATFLERLTAARSVEAEMSAMARLAEDLREQVERQTAVLSAALADVGRERNDADLDSLLAAARRLIQESDDAREARALANGTERRVKAAGKALRDATGRHEETLARWRALSSAAGLLDAVDPVGWRRRQDIVRDIAEAVRRADAERTEGLAARERYDEFVERVTALARNHGVTLDDIATTITELDARREAANTAHRSAEQLAKRIDALVGKIDTRASDRAAVLAELDAIRTRLALPTMADLDDAATRGRVLTEIDAEIEHLTDVVRTAMPDADLDELVSELAAADSEELAAQVADATTYHTTADTLLETARARRAEADHEHRTLAGRTGAAEANADAQAQLAVVETRVERYLVAHIQRTLLRSELAEYERKHASSLLVEAGRLLERLTGGRYVGLRVRHPGVGRSLTVVTADEVDRTTDELSEGTADQVFLALRLAGIAALQDERRNLGLPTLPVVLDDVLMTFDDQRSAAALRVLAELAQDWQVIVLSHHDHLADVVTSLDLPDIAVARLPAPEPLRPKRAPEDVRAIARTSGSDRAELIAVTQNRGRTVTNSGEPDGVPARQIRAWAAQEGIELGERGRIPAAVKEAFYEHVKG